ncbi:MAG: MBL fold metallo-hydrolase [Gemmatimonadaceae bacterium]
MRSSWIALLTATTLATWAPAMAQDHSSIQSVSQAKTGVWTYSGTGTVNTYCIEVPGGGLVIIDVQRDLVHAAQALTAVKAAGKPVRAILVTHAHPDHYTGLGLFRQAFPGVPVYSSKTTADAIRNDTYGANAGEQADAPDIREARIDPPHGRRLCSIGETPRERSPLRRSHGKTSDTSARHRTWATSDPRRRVPDEQW